MDIPRLLPFLWDIFSRVSVEWAFLGELRRDELAKHVALLACHYEEAADPLPFVFGGAPNCCIWDTGFYM